ncbi:MAG: signal peptidase II [Clostridia bacterium]|nr:signal peptidase II [Clostridia bacterium]
MLFTFLFLIGTVVLDQISKHLVLTHLVPVGSYPLWPGVLHFTYVENTGAAFGMLKNHRWVFLIVSTAAILLIVGYILWTKPKSMLERIALASIAGGGIGNMIDRVARGFVVDFIDVTCIDFYVFNVADSFVCVGCGLMILWLFLDEAAQRKAKKTAAEEAPEGSDHEE